MQTNEILINKNSVYIYIYISSLEKSIFCGLGDLESSNNGGKSPTVAYTPWGLFISSFLECF